MGDFEEGADSGRIAQKNWALMPDATVATPTLTLLCAVASSRQLVHYRWDEITILTLSTNFVTK